MTINPWLVIPINLIGLAVLTVLISNCRAKRISTLYQPDSDWVQVSYAPTL